MSAAAPAADAPAATAAVLKALARSQAGSAPETLYLGACALRNFAGRSLGARRAVRAARATLEALWLRGGAAGVHARRAGAAALACTDRGDEDVSDDERSGARCVMW
jgi:hypothetical protein